MLAIHQKLKAKALPYFLVGGKGSGTTIAPVEEYPQFFANVPAELVRESPFPRLSSSPSHSRIKTQQTIAFLDPSADSTHPGWPLRNLLAYLLVLYPSLIHVRILCWRDTDAAPTSGSWKSRFGILNTTTTTTTSALTERPTAVGWEKNPQQKLGPRSADLAPMMDPKRFFSFYYYLVWGISC
jgi:ubiquitin-like modifier-activating enzyme ATG7